MDNAIHKEHKMKVYKVDILVMRSAAFMAGKIQAVCSAKARVDGFGREIFGHIKAVDYSKN